MAVFNVNRSFNKSWCKFLEMKETKTLQNLQTNVLQDSNYIVLRHLTENLNNVKYPKRYVYIYKVDTVNNTHGVNKL